LRTGESNTTLPRATPDPAGFSFQSSILEGYFAQTVRELALMGSAYTLGGFMEEMLRRETGYYGQRQHRETEQLRVHGQSRALDNLVDGLPLDATAKRVWQDKVVAPLRGLADQIRNHGGTITPEEELQLHRSEETVRLLRRTIRQRVTDNATATQLNAALDTCSQFAQDLASD